MKDVYIKPVPVALGGDVTKPVLIQRPAPSRIEIGHWEQENGRLPEDYIAFMMAHNGGTIYPAAFETKVSAAPDWLDLEPVVSIDSFFTWDEFVKANGFLKIDWRVDHVSIAYDNSGGRILLSMQPHDHGAVRYWPRNVADWDEEDDGPLPVATVAATFREFVFNVLFDNSTDGPPRWSIPRDLETATKVSF